MATRSLNQNNFYYAFITDIHKQCLEKHITVENMDYLRNGLKEIDENYPRYDKVIHGVNYNGVDVIDKKPISSAKLTTKQMVDHIEFVIEFVGRFGITPAFVEEDYKRMMELAHN